MGITEEFDQFLFIKCSSITDGDIMWKRYYLSLEDILEAESDDVLTELIIQFGLLTDLVDDLMDKDKEESSFLINHEQELANNLESTLQRMKTHLPSQKFKNFIDCIAQSLLVQLVENDYTLTESSSEKDYFHLVQRSIKLMQSFVYLIESKPSKNLLKAIEYLAINFQIINDLNNFNRMFPSDFLDRKGTLPLVRLLDYAKSQKNSKLLYLLVHSSYDERKETIEIIKNTLDKSGVRMYCQILAISYSNRAKKLLLSICSDEKKVDALLMRKDSFKI